MGLLAMNYMLDLMWGQQIRHWVVQPEFTKKQALDSAARSAGYQFIRDKGPKSNNRNQFMEWADEQIHAPASPMENWNEGKVIAALQNYMRGRQNAKTLEYWPFSLKSFKAWFFNEVLVHMPSSVGQNAITWLGKQRRRDSNEGKAQAEKARFKRRRRLERRRGEIQTKQERFKRRRKESN